MKGGGVKMRNMDMSFPISSRTFMYPKELFGRSASFRGNSQPVAIGTDEQKEDEDEDEAD
jgi:hypothetical protein